jgi:glycosyltransferase involved in cell wall biosynthesis
MLALNVSLNHSVSAAHSLPTPPHEAYMPVLISAIICTHNRASYLRKSLLSLCHQTLDPARFEIVVVDNASTDGSAALVRDEFSLRPNVRYVFEPELGLSVARNTGARESQGAYLAYLDDDAVADSRWLESALEAFAVPRLKIGILGGPILPIWEAPRPDWLPDSLLASLTILDPKLPAGVIDDVQPLFGANLLLSRSAFDAVGGFNVNLGRKGSSLLSNEELALRADIVAAGFVAYFDPKVVVLHHVPSERLQKMWFYRRAYWQGRSNAVQYAAHTRGPTERIRKAMATSHSLARLFIGTAISAVRKNRTATAVFEKKQRIARQLGFLRGLL